MIWCLILDKYNNNHSSSEYRQYFMTYSHFTLLLDTFTHIYPTKFHCLHSNDHWDLWQSISLTKLFFTFYFWHCWFSWGLVREITSDNAPESLFCTIKRWCYSLKTLLTLLKYHEPVCLDTIKSCERFSSLSFQQCANC